MKGAEGNFETAQLFGAHALYSSVTVVDGPGIEVPKDSRRNHKAHLALVAQAE